jgi:hypothetical protein
LGAIDHNKHVVMVNVEADVMVGPILAEKARAKGLIYSMAYGDQPALMHYAQACIRAINNNVSGLHADAVSMAVIQGDALGGGFEAALVLPGTQGGAACPARRKILARILHVPCKGRVMQVAKSLQGFCKSLARDFVPLC